jgi:hypothetical protein
VRAIIEAKIGKLPRAVDMRKIDHFDFGQNASSVPRRAATMQQANKINKFAHFRPATKAGHVAAEIGANPLKNVVYCGVAASLGLGPPARLKRVRAVSPGT